MMLKEIAYYVYKKHEQNQIIFPFVRPVEKVYTCIELTLFYSVLLSKSALLIKSRETTNNFLFAETYDWDYL